MLPAHVSGAISGWLRQLIFGSGGDEGEAVDAATFSLRKLAHFFEFACLGGLFTCLMATLGKNCWYLPLGLGTATSLVDETIQGFVPGRAPMLMDVGVDVLGICLGIVVVNLWRKRRCKNG